MNLIGSMCGLWAMEPKELDGLMSQLRAMNGDFFANMLGNADGQTVAYTVEDGVAKIPIQGVILKDVPEAFRWLGIPATSTTETSIAVEMANDDPSVDEIEFFVDSPGGTVSGVQALSDVIAFSAKPTTAAVSDMAASAAYWLAAQADVVEANASAMVGSIGVYRVMIDSSEAYAEEGLTVHVVKSGNHKGTGTPGAVITDEELEEEQRLIDHAAGMFVEAVARGRGMSIADVSALATGQTWFAHDAKRLGLIDEVYGSAVGAEPEELTSPEMGEEVIQMDPSESANAEILALRQQLEASQDELKGLKAEKDVAAQALIAVRETQKADIINGAIADGRIVPAMADSITDFAEACGEDVDRLRAFVEALPVQVHQEPVSVMPGTDARVELSKDDAAICKLFGIEPADLLNNGTWDALGLDGTKIKREIH